MKIPSLLFLGCLAWAAAGLQAQSPYIINDNLEVTGTLDIQGNSQSLGTLTTVAGAPGVTHSLVEALGSPPTTSTSSLNSYTDLHLPVGNFFWRAINPAGTAYKNVMQLGSIYYGNYNNLTLMDPYTPSTQSVILNTGSSLYSQIPGGLIVKGAFQGNATNNTLIAQTLTGGSSILTRSLGDTRYMMRGDSVMLFGTGSSATIQGSIALGESSLGTGQTSSPAIAIGKAAQARTSTTSGLYGIYHGAVAIGNGAQAGGPGEVGGGIAIGSIAYARSSGIAIGRAAVSTANQSIAIGEHSYAYGDESLVLGSENTVGGFGTQAIGQELISNGYRTTVMGFKNLIPAGEQQYVRQNDAYAFIIGNGSDTWHGTADFRSNAFTIQWDGDGWIQGNFATDKGLTVAEDASIGGDVAVDGELEGTTAKFSDTVRIEPRGGLSMGEFTYDPVTP